MAEKQVENNEGIRAYIKVGGTDFTEMGEVYGSDKVSYK